MEWNGREHEHTHHMRLRINVNHQLAIEDRLAEGIVDPFPVWEMEVGNGEEALFAVDLGRQRRHGVMERQGLRC